MNVLHNSSYQEIYVYFIFMRATYFDDFRLYLKKRSDGHVTEKFAHLI